MDYVNEINSYIPKNDQEAQDKKVILDCIKMFPHNILLRDNEIAHITSSGFILNKDFTKTLLIHHNIRNTWAWTGGHADGDMDMLAVATREAEEEEEETGVVVTSISDKIASLDVLTVWGHIKRGKYVNSHLHLSVAYLFVADEDASRVIKPDENSGVEWFPVSDIVEGVFTDRDVYLYKKLVEQARAWR
ncbi:MAG: NUDIX domain-containing protein [Defluviitaleaceae bacterium]|nr:NUDIX domain-containing protein [Defluviitaleaceae bacterium]